MHVEPRTLARALPWLAAVLGVEGIVALTPTFTGTEISGWTCMGALVHVPEIALLLGFALGVAVMTSGGATRIACQRLLYGGFASLAAVGVGRFVDVDIDVGASRIWLFLHIAAAVLFAVAAPGLWGVALAREQDLSSDRITRVGRIFAGMTFAATGMVAVSELALLLQENPLRHLSWATLALLAASTSLLAGRLLVLWCAADTWRPAPDEGELRSRARAVQRRMIPSSLLGLGSAVMTGFFWRTEAHGVGGWTNRPMVLWHGFAQLTLTVLVAILLAIALEHETVSFEPRKKGSSFPEPPPPPPPQDLGPIDVP
jgi:hypothetical protein